MDFNTFFVPIIIGVIVAITGGIFLAFIRRYLSQADDNHRLRNDSILTVVSNLDHKLTDFCAKNHADHQYQNRKLVNHDHHPETGKPRFYV